MIFGLPLTLLRLKDEEVAVLEMGMNHFNEISLLTNIAKPDLSIITNIGTSHIGNLGSRENILKAKLEILEGMKQKEIVINNDNDLLHNWKNNIKLTSEKTNIKIHTFGIKNKSSVWAENIQLSSNSSTFICHLGNESFKVNVPVGGNHFVYNSLCATLVGNLFGIESHKIQQGIQTFTLTQKRMEITKLNTGATVINDAYNASFESIQASLKTLLSYEQNRKIAVLGDIFELGIYAKEIHQKIGRTLANFPIDILICCGKNSKYIIEEAKKLNNPPQEIYYFKNIAEIKQYLQSNTTTRRRNINKSFKWNEILGNLSIILPCRLHTKTIAQFNKNCAILLSEIV